jgi:hypothetical protein
VRKAISFPFLGSRFTERRSRVGRDAGRGRGGAGALPPPPEPVAVTGRPGGAGCRRPRALALPAPDAHLQLGLVQVLHRVPQETGQEVGCHRLPHFGGTQAMASRGRSRNSQVAERRDPSREPHHSAPPRPPHFAAGARVTLPVRTRVGQPTPPTPPTPPWLLMTAEPGSVTVALTTPEKRAQPPTYLDVATFPGGPTPPATKPQVPEAAAQKDTSIIEKREGRGESTQDGR